MIVTSASRAPAVGLLTADPDASARINEHVDDVDGEVGYEDPDDYEQEDPLQQKVVVIADSLQDEVAESGVGERHLGDAPPRPRGRRAAGQVR